jgi:hypothetical protein
MRGWPGRAAAGKPRQDRGQHTRRVNPPPRQSTAAISAGVRPVYRQRSPPRSPPGALRTPTMDRVKTTKGASYTIMAALMLASAPLILAMPATGAPCGPVGGIVPGLICPESPGRPNPTATPAPSASSTVAPVSPAVPTGTAPAPRSSAVPAPKGTQTAAPTAGPGAPPPAGVPPTSASPADGSTAAPAPTSTAPSAPAPSPAADPLAAKSAASGDLDGRSVVGALLLALGGLLVIAWVAMDIRTSA